MQSLPLYNLFDEILKGKDHHDRRQAVATTKVITQQVWDETLYYTCTQSLSTDQIK